jgi:carbamoyl-phosphate synthase small subunit
MQAYGIVGVEGVDTRCITKHVRTAGAQKSIVTTERISASAAVERARASEGIVGRDLVQFVTCPSPYEWGRECYDLRGRGDGKPWGSQKPLPWEAAEDRAAEGTLELEPLFRPALPLRVVAMDFGIKHNILRRLQAYGVSLVVVPAFWPAEKILEYKPDGIVLSNGPGDPEPLTQAVDTVSHLIGECPIFGICLGHELLALAMGGRIYKLRFGHHGGNQPVEDISTGKVQITTQNHGFAVEMDSLDGKGMVVTHRNLNDGTVEGMEHTELPVFSVQYHPEASPGPHDSEGLFAKFVRMMAQYRGIHAQAGRP